MPPKERGESTLFAPNNVGATVRFDSKHAIIDFGQSTFPPHGHRRFGKMEVPRPVDPKSLPVEIFNICQGKVTLQDAQTLVHDLQERLGEL